jgi:hypothetical protein
MTDAPDIWFPRCGDMLRFRVGLIIDNMEIQTYAGDVAIVTSNPHPANQTDYSRLPNQYFTVRLVILGKGSTTYTWAKNSRVGTQGFDPWFERINPCT